MRTPTGGDVDRIRELHFAAPGHKRIVASVNETLSRGGRAAEEVRKRMKVMDRRQELYEFIMARYGPRPWSADVEMMLREAELSEDDD